MKATRLHLLILLSSGLSFEKKHHSYESVYTKIGHSQGSVRVLLNRLIKEKIIEKITLNRRVHFGLTTAGTQKLRDQLALDYVPKKWDRKWRLLILHKGGNRIMENGFRKLQTGVYITPSAVEKFQFRQGYVVETKQVSPLENKALASHIWRLDIQAKRYAAWIKEAQITKVANTEALISKYTIIVKDDPWLPKELLPSDWPFEQARGLFLKLVKQLFSSTKS